MSPLVLAALALLLAVSLYLAVLCGRALRRPEAFLDGGSNLPAWAPMFAGAGLIVGGLGLQDHLLLTTLYGLQASHVALGLTLAALCSAIAHKRLWIGARATGLVSPIEILSAYYGGVAVRVAMIAVALVLAVPFAANALGGAAELVSRATAHQAGREQAAAAIGFALFLVAALGGWRGVALAVAAQSFLLLALLVFAPVLMVCILGPGAVAAGPPAMKDALADRIPGVMQYSAGIGKDIATGGVFTTLTILGAGASLAGVGFSPAMGLMVTTARLGKGLAFLQVWMIAGLAAGALIVAAPVLAAGIAAADPAALAAGAPSLQALFAGLAEREPLAGVALLMMIFAAYLIIVAAFVVAAAHAAADVASRYLLPRLDGEGRRLAARIALAVLFAAASLSAIYAPAATANLATVALPLSAQSLPAFVGFGWAPWISRQAVVTGLIFGALAVVFTEPPGLIAFEGLFLDLPWGRWPLTIPSTLWGLALNVPVCLLVSLFTKAGPERAHRERLHHVFRAASSPVRAGALRTAKWSLTLIWTFLALGPGAVLGNSFFSRPIFAEGDAKLGAPSLWVWQVAAWFAGVMLVWWLAYRSRLGVIEAAAISRIDLLPPADPFGRRPPPWLALLVQRLSGR